MKRVRAVPPLSLSNLEYVLDVPSVGQIAEDGEDHGPGVHRRQGVHEPDQQGVSE